MKELCGRLVHYSPLSIVYTILPTKKQKFIFVVVVFYLVHTILGAEVPSR